MAMCSGDEERVCTKVGSMSMCTGVSGRGDVAGEADMSEREQLLELPLEDESLKCDGSDGAGSFTSFTATRW